MKPVATNVMEVMFTLVKNPENGNSMNIVLTVVVMEIVMVRVLIFNTNAEITYLSTAWTESGGNQPSVPTVVISLPVNAKV